MGFIIKITHTALKDSEYHKKGEVLIHYEGKGGYMHDLETFKRCSEDCYKTEAQARRNNRFKPTYYRLASQIEYWDEKLEIIEV